MEEITTARERVLKSIRNANLKVDKNAHHDIDHDTPIYPSEADDKLISFAESFNANGGQFVYCAKESELAANILAWKNKNQEYSLVVKDSSLKQFCTHYQLAFTDQVIDSPFAASVVIADKLIARTGSILFSSAKGGSRSVPVAGEKLLVIAYADQLVENMEGAIRQTVKSKTDEASFYTIVTGPSNTSTLENTRVNGVHGPSDIILFLLETN